MQFLNLKTNINVNILEGYQKILSINYLMGTVLPNLNHKAKPFCWENKRTPRELKELNDILLSK